MANPFDAPLPSVGQKPWTLNPAIIELRGRQGTVEDVINTGRLSASGLAEEIAEAAASVEVNDATVANLFAEPTSDTNTALVDQIADAETPVGAELRTTSAQAADAIPAKGTAPSVSARLNLGVPHTLPPLNSLTPAKSGTIPRVNINTVTGISGQVTWPVLADNTGAARWSGPVRVETQTIASIPGCVIMQDLRSPATQGTAGIKWEFDTDAPNFVLDGVWGAGSVLIYRDGELITEGAIGPVGNRYLRIFFYEYSGLHRYEIYGGPGFGLANIITGPNDTVRRPIEPKPLVGFVTDSYGTTFSPISGTSHIGLVGTLSRLMDWRPRTSIEGGSGYLTDGAGAATSKFIDRIPGFDAIPLDAFVLIGGRNDPTTGLTAAARTAIQRVRSAHPGIPIIVGGPWAPNAAWESGSQSGNFAALQAAAEAEGAIYVDTRGIITGEGDITANPGVTGNGSRMIAGAHPTPPSPTDAAYVADGRQYHGYEFARRLTRLIGGY